MLRRPRYFRPFHVKIAVCKGVTALADPGCHMDIRKADALSNCHEKQEGKSNDEL